MARINIENLADAQHLSDDEQKNVQGGAWYAKFDGVDGSSKAEGRRDEIEVDSFSWGATTL